MNILVLFIGYIIIYYNIKKNLKIFCLTKKINISCNIITTIIVMKSNEKRFLNIYHLFSWASITIKKQKISLVSN